MLDLIPIPMPQGVADVIAALIIWHMFGRQIIEGVRAGAVKAYKKLAGKP